MRDQRLLREVAAGRGGKAVLLLNDASRLEVDFVVLTNGGVLYTDSRGTVRWYPSDKVATVLWKEDEE